MSLYKGLCAAARLPHSSLDLRLHHVWFHLAAIACYVGRTAFVGDVLLGSDGVSGVTLLEALAECIRGEFFFSPDLRNLLLTRCRWAGLPTKPQTAATTLHAATLDATTHIRVHQHRTRHRDALGLRSPTPS